MRIKLHIFSEDTNSSGTDATVFLTEQELHDHMAHVMFSGMDGVHHTDRKVHILPDNELCNRELEIIELYNGGEVEEAFYEWTQSCADHNDTYNWSSQDVYIHEITALVEAAQRAITALENPSVHPSSEGQRSDVINALTLAINNIKQKGKQ